MVLAVGCQVVRLSQVHYLYFLYCNHQEHRDILITNYSVTLITLDELEKVLKLTKNCKIPGQDNINSELYKYAPKDFKLRLLYFLNKIYRQNRIPDEWRNAVITPIFKKGDRREPKNYRGISILNTCYKIYAKILNMKLQKYSEAFLSETQNGF